MEPDRPGSTPVMGKLLAMCVWLRVQLVLHFYKCSVSNPRCRQYFECWDESVKTTGNGLCPLELHSSRRQTNIMHKKNMQVVRKGMEKQNKVGVIEKVLRAGGAV